MRSRGPPLMPLLSTDTTECLLTGSADWTARLWDTETGKELYSMMHKVRPARHLT